MALPMTQQQLNFDERVADRIQSLLARCDQLRRGSDMKSTYFDERGEREARRVAERDRQHKENQIG